MRCPGGDRVRDLSVFRPQAAGATTLVLQHTHFHQQTHQQTQGKRAPDSRHTQTPQKQTRQTETHPPARARQQISDTSSCSPVWFLLFVCIARIQQMGTLRPGEFMGFTSPEEMESFHQFFLKMSLQGLKTKQNRGPAVNRAQHGHLTHGRTRWYTCRGPASS